MPYLILLNSCSQRYEKKVIKQCFISKMAIIYYFFIHLLCDNNLLSHYLLIEIITLHKVALKSHRNENEIAVHQRILLHHQFEVAQ